MTMILTHTKLRALVESILLEGFKDDQRYLIEKHPDHAADLSSLPPKWISWLSARFGEKPSRDEVHPFEDAIVTVVSFSKRDSGLSAKYTSPGTEEKPNVFRKSVDEAFPPADRSWSSPADAMTMTVDEMETILRLAERKKERFSVNVDEDDMESDRVGKVGPWNLWMPTTRERSCKIAGYDPVTRKPHTTWCTARMAGSNLFYNYIGAPGREITLFYIIRDNPESTSDWLSVGFVDGSPELSGQMGGVSVDRNNNGLTPRKLKSILGSDHDEIMLALKRKNMSLGGRHPARQKIAAAATSLKDFHYLIRGISREEAIFLMRAVAKEPVIHPDVLREIIKMLDSSSLASMILTRDSIPEDIMLELAEHPDPQVKDSIATKASQEDSNVPESVVLKLWNGSHEGAKIILSRHRLFDDADRDELLRSLIKSRKKDSRAFVAERTKEPEILTLLASDERKEVRLEVAVNKSTPVDALIRLTQDKDSDVKSFAIQRSELPLDVIDQLSRSDDVLDRRSVAWNLSTPPEILSRLARDEKADVRRVTAGRERTPSQDLKIMLNDMDRGVRYNARQSLMKRDMLDESRLLQLIRQLVR